MSAYPPVVSDKVPRPQAAPPAHPLPAPPPRRRAPGPCAVLHGPAGGVPRGAVLAVAADEAARCGASLDALLGVGRSAELVAVRRRAMLRARRETGASIGLIARVFKRNEATVSRALRAAASTGGQS